MINAETARKNAGNFAVRIIDIHLKKIEDEIVKGSEFGYMSTKLKVNSMYLVKLIDDSLTKIGYRVSWVLVDDGIKITISWA